MYALQMFLLSLYPQKGILLSPKKALSAGMQSEKVTKVILNLHFSDDTLLPANLILVMVTGPSLCL